MLQFYEDLEEYDEIKNSFKIMEKEETEWGSFLSPIPGRDRDLSLEKDFKFDEEEIFDSNSDKLESIYSQNLEHKKKKKIKKQEKKRKRRNKKDDFDYETYINNEIQKIDTKNMSHSTKKKLIQKIRNRMSAQRSRMRQKNKMSFVQCQNKELKQENEKLYTELEKLKKQNELLKSKISNPEEILSSEIILSDSLTRESTKSNNSLLKKSILFIACIMTIFIISPENTNKKVQKGGILPVLKTRHIIEKKECLEEKCKNYCSNNYDFFFNKKHNGFSTEKQVEIFYNPKGGLELWKNNVKLNKETDSLICVRTDEEFNEHSSKMFLFDKNVLNMIEENDDVYYVPNVVQIKLEEEQGLERGLEREV